MGELDLDCCVVIDAYENNLDKLKEIELFELKISIKLFYKKEELDNLKDSNKKLLKLIKGT